MRAGTYNIIRKIHLYASLPIVALLLMYIVSSYFMIHSQSFGTYQRTETVITVEVNSDMVSEDHWDHFLTKNGISGKLINETTGTGGELIRKYERAGKAFEIKLLPDEKLAEIKASKGNLPGILVGLHRIRGFDGPWQYMVYGILLDIVGVSLILFAISGAILWLKLLKNNRLAWIIFLAGFVYVAAIIIYLSVG